MRDAPRRSLLIPWIAFFAMLALTLGLGSWQLQRKIWKEDLIATMERRASGPPAPVAALPRDASVALGDNEFRRVTLTGRFIHVCEFPLFTAMREGAGWTIITAFQRDGDDAPRDLVIRGVVPDPLRDPARRAAGQIEGPVSITGRLRADHLKGGSTVLPNEPDKNRWYSRDLGQMAALGCGGMPRTARDGAPAFFVEYDGAVPPGGWPRPEPGGVQLTNNHLQYAITWFALAGVLIGMFGYWLLVQRRERSRAG